MSAQSAAAFEDGSESRFAAALRQEPLYELLGLEPGAHLKADLHAHTTVSDGSDTFVELMGKARVHGVTHLAVTNHDTTTGLSEVVRTAHAHAFKVVPGVEISAWDPDASRRVHILGLDVSEGAPAIAELCTQTLERRTANTVWQMKQLIDAGYDVDVDKAAALAGASTGFYKQHLMAALTDAPFTSGAYQHLYKALFKGSGICARDIAYVDMRDAVEAVLADGGVPVLAHPGQFDNYDAVPALVDAGLAGIEKYHPDHDYADCRLVEELACRYGLFCTGGSDYHGRFGKVPHPGYRFIAE